MLQWDKCQIGEGLDGANAEDLSRRQKYCSPPNCSLLRNTFILKFLKGIEEKMSLSPNSLLTSSAKCFLLAKAALYFTLKCNNFSDRRARYVSFYSLHYR